MTAADPFPHVDVANEGELHDWLRNHHGQHDAVWLVTFKKAVPGKYIPHDGVLDHLVAFGWIDGIRLARVAGVRADAIQRRNHRKSS